MIYKINKLVDNWLVGPTLTFKVLLNRLMKIATLLAAWRLDYLRQTNNHSRIRPKKQLIKFYFNTMSDGNGNAINNKLHYIYKIFASPVTPTICELLSQNSAATIKYTVEIIRQGQKKQLSRYQALTYKLRLYHRVVDKSSNCPETY